MYENSDNSKTMQGMEVKYSIRKGKTNTQKEKKTLKAFFLQLL
jgi:hypothetical protein